MSNSKQQQRLGRGLEALIPKSFLVNGKTILNIPISDIQPNPYQPRKTFDEEALKSLAHSIGMYGLNQPILVRKQGDHYELIAGERRFRASQMANLTMVPAIVKNVSDRDSLQLALVENLEREDLNPMEESLGYKRLVEEFEMTHQDIATMFGKSRSAISNSLRLLQLPQVIQDAITNNEIAHTQARTLLGLSSEQEMLRMFEALKNDGLNVRELETKVSDKKNVKPSNTNQQLNLFKELETQLSDRYESPIKIKGSQKKGRIEIVYKSKEELEKLYNLLMQS